MSMQPRIIATGLLFVAMFGTGFWLTRAGKPRSAALLTVHKLVSLAALVLIALIVSQLHSQAPLAGRELGAVAAAAGLFVLTIATGGVLSTDRPAPPVVSVAHKVTPYLSVLSTAVTVYLLAAAR